VSRPARLWLFDIDGTLVDTGGAGMAALGGAVLECFGQPGPPLDLAGSTDSGIVLGLCRHFGREADDAWVAAFYACYLGHLDVNLAGGGFPGRVLPGVVGMLETLARGSP
jgi:phosphoglycolate phosphatase-like HAD superfamily hydrolase